jgi:hypothetical protein
MLISTPQLSDEDFVLTPTMVRGAYLIWRSELQRGQQLAEIRELDGPATPDFITSRTSPNCSVVDGE